MGDEGKISIIVPVYNVRNMLGRCIDSIICQSYTNIEIIIVDDGSTDGSGEMCEEYARIDSRIKTFHKENGGLSDARNYGMLKAQGDYFIFIDSDDAVHRDFCLVLYDAIQKHNADIASTDIVNFESDHQLSALSQSTIKSVKVIDGYNILNEYFFPSTRRLINHGLCMKIYRRELFSDLWFEVGRLHEDLFITYRLLDKCKRFVFIDAPYYFYYQKNENSISNNYGKQNFLDEYEGINRVMAYFRGREKVENSMRCFCAYHYLYMLYRIGISKDINVIRTKHLIRKWICLNLVNLKLIGIGKKIKIFLGCFLPGLYYSFRRLKDSKHL